jgi:hypothetical protein
VATVTQTIDIREAEFRPEGFLESPPNVPKTSRFSGTPSLAPSLLLMGLARVRVRAGGAQGMKNLSVIALFTFLLVGPAARPAEASLFTLQTYTLSMHTNSASGLALWSQNLLPAPSAFELSTVGQSHTANLFRIGTSEQEVNPDDWYQRPLNVGFGFSTPLPAFGGTTTGISGAINFLGGLGYVAWSNPIQLAFGTNGLLQVSLSNVIFGVPGSAVVQATFTLIREDNGGTPVGVPEPSTLLLMGAGLVSLASRYRRLSRVALVR